MKLLDGCVTALRTTMSPTSMSDPVNHPKHYTAHPSGIECIEIAEAFDFCSGNAIKYIWRSDEKGYLKQDLEKALWYVRRARANRAHRNSSVFCMTVPYEKMRRVLDAEPSSFRRHTLNALYEASRTLSTDLADSLYETAEMLILGEIGRLS